MKIKVLVIDDADYVHNKYIKDLDLRQISVVSAHTLKEGYDLFSNTLYFDAIVVDGCVDNLETLDSLHLIRYIKSLHTGPIIAASSVKNFRQKMIEAGCTDECEKEDVPQTVLKLLNLD